jgi:hypothetical protein
MKIIASKGVAWCGDSEVFLVEATAGELANIAGAQYVGSGFKPAVGMSLDVSTIWRRLRDIDNARSNLEGAQKTLRAIADLCEPLKDAVTFQDTDREES